MLSRHPDPEQPDEGQESVWDYPRPPALAESGRARWRSSSAARPSRAPRGRGGCSRPAIRRRTTCRARRSHPGCSGRRPARAFCEWKGQAVLLRPRRRRSGRRARGLDLPRPEPGVRGAHRGGRGDPARGRPLPGRRRGGAPAGGRLLRRLDHQQAWSARSRAALAAAGGDLTACPAASSSTSSQTSVPMPATRSRCWSRSCAASSTRLWCHSDGAVDAGDECRAVHPPQVAEDERVARLGARRWRPR